MIIDGDRDAKFTARFRLMLEDEGLEEFWPVLFEAILEGWATDESHWPKNRTLEMFRKWFEIQMISLVQDLGLDEPLEYFE